MMFVILKTILNKIRFVSEFRINVMSAKKKQSTELEQ